MSIFDGKQPCAPPKFERPCCYCSRVQERTAAKLRALNNTIAQQEAAAIPTACAYYIPEAETTSGSASAVRETGPPAEYYDMMAHRTIR